MGRGISRFCCMLQSPLPSPSLLNISNLQPLRNPSIDPSIEYLLLGSSLVHSLNMSIACSYMQRRKQQIVNNDSTSFQRRVVLTLPRPCLDPHVSCMGTPDTHPLVCTLFQSLHCLRGCDRRHWSLGAPCCLIFKLLYSMPSRPI